MFSFVPRCQGGVRVAEVDVEVGIYPELSMLGHLGSLVPGPERGLGGQCRDRRQR